MSKKKAGLILLSIWYFRKKSVTNCKYILSLGKKFGIPELTLILDGFCKDICVYVYVGLRQKIDTKEKRACSRCV